MKKEDINIILHSRGEIKNQDNLICIEMKKSTATEDSKEKDRRRLSCLTRNEYEGIYSYDGKVLPQYVCGYLLGIYYEISIRKKLAHLDYYQNGLKIKEYDVNI